MDESRQPGAPEAVEAGCTCPPGQTGPTYTADKDCPLHGLAMVAAELGADLRSAPPGDPDAVAAGCTCVRGQTGPPYGVASGCPLHHREGAFEKPMIELPVHLVACRVHGEPFRERWPSGYAVFTVTLATSVMAGETLQWATGGEASRLNSAVMEFGPLCGLATRDELLAAYVAAAEVKGWAGYSTCAPCGRFQKGAMCTFRVQGRLEKIHICFRCIAGASCQETEPWDRQ